MDAPKPPVKPALDLVALGARAGGWLRAAGRGLANAVHATRVSLGKAAAKIAHEPTRKFLVGVLTPKALPAGESPPRERDSGEHLRGSGAHSQPSLRSSGAHSQPDLSGGSNPRPSGAQMKRVVPRKGAGTFTPATPTASGPKHSLTGGSKKLSEDEVNAVKHDARRRKEEARARGVIDQYRTKLGKFKLEKLGDIPRTLAPEPLAEFRKAHPAVTAEVVQAAMPFVASLSRDVCDRAAVRADWTEAERMTFLNAIPPETRERHKAAIDALQAMPGEARQAFLRLPRVPNVAQVDALAAKWATLPADEIRTVALALAQFYGTELHSVIRAAAPPVKVAPKGIRG